MATINLGAIKFNWKGAYNSGNSYAVDDVVSSGGNSYVCIQAHSTAQAVGNATAYWNIMSSAGTNGTNGTDVGTTITTQGDILYRDGSGLQRLAAGTSGQFLKTQGTGANPVWGDAGGGLVQTVYASNAVAYQQGGNTYGTGNNLLVTGSITPTSASNKIIIMAEGDGSVSCSSGSASRDSYFQISRDISGGASGTQIVETSQRLEQNQTYAMIKASVMTMDTSHNSTAQLTYHFQTKGEGGGWDTFWQQNGGKSNMILMEVKV